MTKCRVCNTEIIKFFSLGKMPLVNAFRKKKDSPEKKYDLSIGFCSSCYLVQLMKHVNPKLIFEDYIYMSSVSQSVLDHSKKTAKHLTKKLKLSKESLVMETGSNDGVQLQYYKNLGIPVLGIDPAKNIAKIANAKGIPTLAEFFNLSFAKKLVKTKSIQADLIYGANMFAHVPKIVDFVAGVKTVLKKNGTAVFESPYLEGLFENKFDSIYHEHVFYYSLIALQNLFKTADLEVYDIEFVTMAGGSMRVFAGHKGMHKISPRVIKLKEKEIKKGYRKLETYKKMNERIEKLKKNVLALLEKLRNEGKSIVAYGAPAKGVILLNYFAISKYLDFIVDKSKAKQNLYVPGSTMKVFPVEKIMESKPDYVFILAWNLADEITKQLHEYKKQGGKFIIPIPTIKII